LAAHDTFRPTAAGAPLEGEVLRPGGAGSRAAQAVRDEDLGYLAALLDDMFRIPGTRIRFGLDPVVGLIPGAGDLLMALAASLIIFSGWQRGLARVTLARMVVNLGIDTLLGSVPIAGNIFDVAWKANRRNYRLLQREQGQFARRHTWRDWAFLGLLLSAVAAAALLPIVLLVLLFRALLG
jgi:hypothetical protein